MLFNIDKTAHHISICNISESGINEDEQVFCFCSYEPEKNQNVDMSMILNFVCVCLSSSWGHFRHICLTQEYSQ